MLGSVQMVRLELNFCAVYQFGRNQSINIDISSFERVKVKESRNRPGVAQRVPGGLDSKISMTRRMKVVRSASRTGRFYPPGNVPGTHFTRGRVDPRDMVRSERNVTEKSSDTTGNRSRDRPTSSAAP